MGKRPVLFLPFKGLVIASDRCNLFVVSFHGTSILLRDLYISKYWDVVAYICKNTHALRHASMRMKLFSKQSIPLAFKAFFAKECFVRWGVARIQLRVTCAKTNQMTSHFTARNIIVNQMCLTARNNAWLACRSHCTKLQILTCDFQSNLEIRVRRSAVG